MIIPSVRHCDFCNEVIKQGDVWTQVVVPMPPSVRAKLVDYYSKQMGDRIGSSMFQMFPAESMIPNTWSLEQCLSCTQGLLPMALDSAAHQAMAALDAAITAKRRNAESMAAIEED